jgi:putative YhdH/YhfP family quinone oxidoreductase
VSAAALEPVIRVEAAGFNYKDALCCRGHPGVMRVSPLVPGIDAAGTLMSQAAGMPAGAAVVVTGHGLGERMDGSFATHVRVPASAVLPLPAGLSAEGAMMFGTAGLTALLALDRLDHLVDPRHARPDEEWLVTGASGGVGMVAVAVLAASGKRVVACTRKPAAAAALEALGAAVVVSPSEVVDPTPKSLAKSRWAGVVDAVGGPLLADILRSVRVGGAVAAVGMAGGADLVTTVHPFILRGVTLAGIDVAVQPSQDDRRRLWERLAAAWPGIRERLPVARLRLEEVGDHAAGMLAGETIGRGVVIP